MSAFIYRKAERVYYKIPNNGFRSRSWALLALESSCPGVILLCYLVSLLTQDRFLSLPFLYIDGLQYICFGNKSCT